jgi:Oxidoreductase molybdopterin binding domain
MKTQPSNTRMTNRMVKYKTIFSFVVFIVVSALGIGGFLWLKAQPLDQGLFGGVQEPLRAGLEMNEKLFSALADSNRLAKAYTKSAAAPQARVNGDIGLDTDEDTLDWHLIVVKANGDSLLLNLADLKRLPKTEVVFDFKCIEGWNQISHWGGIKFSDFIKYYHLEAEAKSAYIGLVTPDEQYYVGIDMKSALHEQTLLCYELNGKPLPLNQGYPLRMILTVKYGIKSLKRIGTLFFSTERPRDYWYERGYDYYSGL